MKQKNKVFGTILILSFIAVIWYVIGCAAKPKDQPTLRVVAIFPMTGPGASIGEFLHKGTLLAEEEIKDRFRGRLQVQVDIIDSKNQPKEAVSALQASMARSRPHAVITALSSVSSAVKSFVEGQGIVTVATTTALSDLLVGTKQMIRVYPTSDNFVRPVAEYMAGRYKRVAILYIHDDFGESNNDVFRSIMQRRNVNVVAAEPYELLQSDTRPLVSKIASAGPEAVYVVGYGPAYSRLFTHLAELAPNITAYADISLPNPAVLTALGKVADGIIFDGTDVELTVPETKAAAAFRKRYTERFQQEPYMVAGFAYDSLMMLAEASLHAGVFAPPNRESLVALSPYGGIMGSITLNKSGESNIPLKLMLRKNGTTVLLAQ